MSPVASGVRDRVAPRVAGPIDEPLSGEPYAGPRHQMHRVGLEDLMHSAGTSASFRPGPEPASRPRTPDDHVALLAEDQDFLWGLKDDDARVARRSVLLPRLDLAAGGWEPPARAPWPGPVTGILVLGGVMARDVFLAGRPWSEFIGAGDVVDPWAPPDDGLSCAVRWRAYEPVTAAALDGTFALAARRWPSLAIVVQRKLSQRADRLAAQSAALRLPRVEERVLAALWQLAGRFGRVRADGILLPIPLSHAELGRLVGARRPTVSLAVRELDEAGTVTRCDDGCWLLSAGSRERLEQPVTSDGGPRATGRARASAGRGAGGAPRGAGPDHRPSSTAIS